MLSGTYYPTSPLVLQNIVFMSSAIYNFSIKSDMFMELTTVVKIKLQKYLMELPAVFTCSAALNPCINVIGVDTLFDEINVNLRLYKDNLEWASFTKAKFANDFKSLYDVYNDKYGNSVQKTFFQSSQSSRGSSSSQDPTVNLYNLMRNENVKR